MTFPVNASRVVVKGYWWTDGGTGVPREVTATPTVDHVTSLSGRGVIDLEPKSVTPEPGNPYWEVEVVASDDPDLSPGCPWTFRFSGYDGAWTVVVPHDADEDDDDRPSVWLTDLDDLVEVDPPQTADFFYTKAQVNQLLADHLGLTVPNWDPHPQYALDGQAPSGAVGGVLSGSLPNPGFANDMAYQSELDAVAAAIPEQARDALGTALVAGANVTVTPNDGADTITIAVSGLTEAAQDAVAALIAGGTHSGISFAYNDAGDAISATVTAQSWSQITGKPTFAAVATSGSASDITTGTLADAQIASTIARDSEVTAAVSAASTTDRDRANHTGTQASTTISDFAEAVQDAVAALLGAGSNITLNYDDTGNTLTVTGTGAGGLDAEAVRDAIGVAVVGVGNIAVTVNDGADTITISTTATVNSTDAALRDRATHTGTQSADSVVDGTTNHVFTAADDTKLGGIATGATANSADATLLARANHTGTQAAATVTGLATVATSGSAADLTGTLDDARIPAGIARDSEVTTAVSGKASLIENVNTVATSGATQTLPAAATATIHDLTLTAACTLTFPTLAAGASFTLVLRQDATGARTVTWPAGVKWPAGTAPVLSTAASAVDTLTFLCVTGANWQGFLAGKGMA